MQRYENSQIGWPILVILLGIATALITVAETPNWVGASILFLAALVYWRLKVKITSDDIICQFGIGIRKKSFKTKNLISFQKCKISVLQGLGERYPGRKEEIYNVTASNGVELVFSDERRIKIATRDADGLLDYLTSICGGDAHGSTL